MIRKYRGEMRYIVGRMKRHENLECISKKEGKHRNNQQDADEEEQRHTAITNEDEMQETRCVNRRKLNESKRQTNIAKKINGDLLC